MDIHKPKPWHGVREFLKEYLIVVVGVLTALGAEAVVEKLHENRLSEEARAAVRSEINLDLANLQRRTQWQSCLDARLAELSDLISKAEVGQPFEPAKTIGNPGAPTFTTARWEASTAGGRTALLSLDEQRDYARLYEEFSSVFGHEQAETQAWSELMALEGVAHPSPELLTRARVALVRARFENWAVRSSLEGAARLAARSGVQPAPDKLFTMDEQADRELLCMPVSTPRAEAAKRVRDPLGAY